MKLFSVIHPFSVKLTPSVSPPTYHPHQSDSASTLELFVSHIHKHTHTTAQASGFCLVWPQSLKKSDDHSRRVNGHFCPAETDNRLLFILPMISCGDFIPQTGGWEFWHLTSQKRCRSVRSEKKTHHFTLEMLEMHRDIFIPREMLSVLISEEKVLSFTICSMMTLNVWLPV